MRRNSFDYIFFAVYILSTAAMYGGVPAREVQRSDQVSDVSQQADSSDLLVNNLSYHQPEALSLAVSRSYSRQFFQRANYSPAETAVIDFNAGTEFVDPANSYLTFVMTPAITGAGAGMMFGAGSAMNLIRQVTIKSRSGTELDRVERANLWSLYNTVYTNSDSYLSRQGLMEGFRVDRRAAATDQFVTAVGYKFAIPLSRLAPFFNPIKRGQKIPPQLMSGLHMEIIWEATAQAFVNGATGGGSAQSYAISSLAIMVDSVCMTDDVQKTINDQSSRDGLEYSYPRVFTATDSLASGATTLNSQVRKAVSQANIAYTICLNSASQNSLTFDSFAAVPWDISRFQYRLGALYYPIQAIEDSSPAPTGIESYVQAIETFDKLKHPFSESSVSLNDFLGNSAAVPGTFTLGYGMMAVSLEKDTALNFSGLPVNNSRVLENMSAFSAGSRQTGTPITREFVTFLEYSSVSRSYIDNTAVSI